MIFFSYLRLLLLFHPFKVSVMDMEYDEGERRMNISMHVFLNDLEDALTAHGNLTSYDILRDTLTTQTLLPQYLLARFRIRTNKKFREVRWLGYEADIDALWCYFDISRLRPFDSLYVESRVLTEMFASQHNIVHATRGGEVRSLRLSKTDPSGVVRWE